MTRINPRINKYAFIIWKSKTPEVGKLHLLKSLYMPISNESTDNASLTLTLVSLYNCGRTESSRSRTSEGLLCAAELNATRATRRTFRSGSWRVRRNSPILCRKSGSIACG